MSKSFNSIPRIVGSGGGVSQMGPFAIFRAENVDGDGQESVPTVKINLFSSVLKSENPYDKITITGLDSPIRLDEVGNPGYIWLDVDLINETANIDFGNAGWDGFPIASKYNENGTQTNAYILIASVFDWGNEFHQGMISVGDYYILRHIYQDLILMGYCGRVFLLAGASGGIV